MVGSEEIDRLLNYLDELFAQDNLCNMLSTNEEWHFMDGDLLKRYWKTLDVYGSEANIVFFDGQEALIAITFFNQPNRYNHYPKVFQCSLSDPKCLEKSAQFIQSRGI